MSERNEKHTPGPWEITSISQNTGNIGVGHKEQRILIAEVTNAASFGDMLLGAMQRGGGGFEQDDCHTQFANARLIAAAPELLRLVRTLIDNDPSEPIADSGETVFDMWKHQARTVVAKASPPQGDQP